MDFIKENWELIKDTLRTEYDLSDISYNTWVKPLSFHSVKDDIVTITVKPENFNGVLTVLEQNKIQTESAEIAMVPISTVAIPDDKVASFEKLIDTLENNEDVQAVYHNAE